MLALSSALDPLNHSLSASRYFLCCFAGSFPTFNPRWGTGETEHYTGVTLSPLVFRAIDPPWKCTEPPFQEERPAHQLGTAHGRRFNQRVCGFSSATCARAASACGKASVWGVSLALLRRAEEAALELSEVSYNAPASAGLSGRRGANPPVRIPPHQSPIHYESVFKNLRPVYCLSTRNFLGKDPFGPFPSHKAAESSMSTSFSLTIPCTGRGACVSVSSRGNGSCQYLQKDGTCFSCF